ncbi:anti-RssB factor [Klebsiella michiganensis]|nr:anti-RssB factor [Klebsiella michiganensis]
MNNVILSIIAKISAMDAESKQLAAQAEAQSLLISALMLAIGKEGGVAELVSSVTKAINSVLESSEDVLKTDAETASDQVSGTNSAHAVDKHPRR